MIQIDGEQGEGGGQVLRTALALSMLTGEPVHIINIRANRRNPGLAPQHLAGVLAAAEICNAEADGAELRSRSVFFRPSGPARPGGYVFDVAKLARTGSAGAVTLLLQTILLPIALADGESSLTLRGGTHVNWSPPAHYTQWVLLPTLARMGLEAEMHIAEYGWYPRGEGEVRLQVAGRAILTGLDLTTRGDLEALRGLAVASNLPAHIPQRISGRANNLLGAAGLPPRVEPKRESSPSTGTGIFMAVSYENTHAGFSALGKQGKPSEVVANEATEPLLDFHEDDAALDEHLPDQLLLAMALADGPSAITTTRITRHLRTVIDVIGQFIQRKIAVEGELDQPGTIRVMGNPPKLPG